MEDPQVEEVERTPIAKFVADNKIKAISVVKENKNGLLYVTMLGEEFEEGNANIYLSKNASKVLGKGQMPSEYIKGASIAHTTNADGDARLKLSVTQYESIEGLL